jgi:hypothetical protein
MVFASVLSGRGGVAIPRWLAERIVENCGEFLPEEEQSNE